MYSDTAQNLEASVTWLYIDSVPNCIHAGRINLSNVRLNRAVLRFMLPVSLLPFLRVGHVSQLTAPGGLVWFGSLGLGTGSQTDCSLAQS